jgi:anti-sigma-K factor RskA
MSCCMRHALRASMARTRRRNQRMALGKLTSSWRSASAAASILPYADAA